MTASQILVQLVVVLGTATVVTVVFQALRLPVVLGYILAGLVIGPHVPVPLVADAELVHVLSELGVILLVFTIGLELPIAKFAKVGLAGALIALFKVSIVATAGTLVASLLGMDATTAVVAGACLGISSTMLVVRSFDEYGIKGGFVELVYAILVFEDLIAIVLLAVLATVSSGAGLDAEALAVLVARLVGFLALMLVGGLVIVPRAIRWIADRARGETLLVASLAVCFGFAALADAVGFSVALGAFLAGVLVAESGRVHDVEKLVEPFRDVFAMVFFVSVGMSIDPAALVSQAPAIIALSVVVFVMKPLGVGIAGVLAGRGVRPSLRAGLSLAQIGELSFVLAGVAGGDLLAIMVGICCVTAAMSPLVVRHSEGIAAWLAHRLPNRVATFASFYDAWLDRVRARGGRRYRRVIAGIAFDAVVVVAIVIFGATMGDRLISGWGVVVAVMIACAPFAYGIARRIAILGHRLAADVIAGGELGYAPRKAFAATIELAITLAIIVPIAAIVQPFVPGSIIVLPIAGVVLVAIARRSIADFDAHVHATSKLVVEALVGRDPTAGLAQVEAMAPGFADTRSIAIFAGAPSVGRTLAELDLRAKTGATVLAIVRGADSVATPSPDEPLRAGDVLAIAGSAEAIAGATILLGPGDQVDHEP